MIALILMMMMRVMTRRMRKHPRSVYSLMLLFACYKFSSLCYMSQLQCDSPCRRWRLGRREQLTACRRRLLLIRRQRLQHPLARRQVRKLPIMQTVCVHCCNQRCLVVWYTYALVAAGDKKGAVHVATPHPAKKAGKTPATNEKSPKSGGSVVCKSCPK